MGSSGKHGVKGKSIELFSEYNERSGSGHLESGSSAELIGIDDDILVLKLSSYCKNFYKLSTNDEKVEKYKISVSELIDLIKKNARKIK